MCPSLNILPENLISDYKQAGHSSTEDLPKYPFYNFALNKSGVIWKDSDVIPIDRVIERLSVYIDPLLGEFVENKRDRAFLDIKKYFFEALFFLPEIFVQYDPEEEQAYLYAICETKYTNWYALKRSGATSAKFVDLITFEQVEISLDDIVRVENGSFVKNKFYEWFSFTYTNLAFKHIFKQAMFLGCHRAEIQQTTNREQNPLYMENEISKLTNLDCFIKTNAKKMFSITAIVFWTTEELKALQDIIYLDFDREIYELSRVSNLNDKEERKTTGENYKDIHGVACRQKLLLDQLIGFQLDAAELWGWELEFAIIGLLDKENLQGSTNGEQGTPEGSAPSQGQEIAQ